MSYSAPQFGQFRRIATSVQTPAGRANQVFPSSRRLPAIQAAGVAPRGARCITRPGHASEDPVIEIEQAGFSYDGRTVLHDVTLTVSPGSFHLLVGASGSGKSTLLRICCMDLIPTDGRIRFFGRPIRRNDRAAIADLRRAIGVLEQDAAFLDHLSVGENIALPLHVSGVGPELRSGDLQALLEWVDLDQRDDALPPALSAGERQRAALARAVILSPEVILCDEPTGSVDWDVALQLLELLLELNRMGKAVLVATHDPNLVRVLEGQVDLRVLHAHAGRIEAAEAYS
jgi:cell division transport system ATP-binding protein